MPPQNPIFSAYSEGLEKSIEIFEFKAILTGYVVEGKKIADNSFDKPLGNNNKILTVHLCKDTKLKIFIRQGCFSGAPVTVY
jgi:hypothetical protein